MYVLIFRFFVKVGQDFMLPKMGSTLYVMYLSVHSTCISISHEIKIKLVYQESSLLRCKDSVEIRIFILLLKHLWKNFVKVTALQNHTVTVTKENRP